MKAKRKINKYLISAAIAFASFSAILGNAKWNFSGGVNTSGSQTINIHAFKFNATWEGSDVLTDEAYQSANDFLNIMNDSSSDEFDSIWDHRKTVIGYQAYVGTPDSNVADDLRSMLSMSSKANCIIYRTDDGAYDLYITYEKLYKTTGTIYPVYRTKYRTVNGELVAEKSWVGTCNRSIYATNDWSYSFNTQSFKAD